MGTSASSTGAPSGVPLVPPWVPPPPDDDGSDDGNAPNEPTADQQPAVAVPPPPSPLAPSGRFGPARTNLGQYARAGSADDMRRGLGHYVGKGLGGSGLATRRFGGTARTAGALFGALSSVPAGQGPTPESTLDLGLLDGRTANEIIDALIEGIRPIDGTQDTEASRRAINGALSELLTRFPEADLLRLSEEERLFAIERYVVGDIYSRFVLDVGKAIQNNALTAISALARLKEVKDYIGQVVSAAFRRARAGPLTLNVGRIAQMVRQVLGETFQVFEDYLQ